MEVPTRSEERRVGKDGSTDPSLQDLGLNIQGENDIAEDDIGF